MSESDKARRDAYVREYYGRDGFWRVVSMAIVMPAWLFCAVITPEGNLDNLIVMALVFGALLHLFLHLDKRRVTKKHFPPKQSPKDLQ